MNCLTCKHWEHLSYGDDYWDGADRHPTISGSQDESNDWRGRPAPGRWGWCHRPDFYDITDESARMVVADGSQYKATLRTRSDFGCVQHEPAEGAATPRLCEQCPLNAGAVEPFPLVWDET